MALKRRPSSSTAAVLVRREFENNAAIARWSFSVR